ncbi:glycosyltransferase [Limosilactobacillus reuteri]|uniref:glycosyltransferase n=1 Tax=Limosilactobacillus reuteri TaxID=1598 RepID=UPI0015FBB685|nr:glycosyltransferase [Limosilactobacillus reuteri]MBB1071733.1 glycosyltransferase [Limosilactobacillus reuteri]MCC4511179.1 glycosyltransferase [Limosilactobacillus reuteri]MCC4512826.1 glycosyltransferase [Limosilactobacillus reuteri]
MNETVSVIMTVYNEPLEILQEAVNSIIDQTYKKIEFIIVIDNPYNNGAINYIRKVQLNNPKVKLIINDKNIGLPLSLNKAIKVSKGNYIARMDADDISDKNRIYKEFLFLKKKKVDLVGCNIDMINNIGKKVGKTSYPQHNFIIKRMLRNVDCVPHPTWFLKKQVYEKLNGYRNIEACEDYDFLLRAVLNNVKIAVLHERLLKYRINNSGISLTKNNIQKITARFLQKSYKNGDIYSVNSLNRFLESQEAQTLFKNFNDYKSLKNNLKNKQNIIITIGKLLQNEELWYSVKNKFIMLVIR